MVGQNPGRDPSASARNQLALLLGVTSSEPCGEIATHGNWDTVGTLVWTPAGVEEIPRHDISESQAGVLRLYAVSASINKSNLFGWQFDSELGWTVDVRAQHQDRLRLRSSSRCSGVVGTVPPIAGLMVPSGR